MIPVLLLRLLTGLKKFIYNHSLTGCWCGNLLHNTLPFVPLCTWDLVTFPLLSSQQPSLSSHWQTRETVFMCTLQHHRHLSQLQFPRPRPKHGLTEVHPLATSYIPWQSTMPCIHDSTFLFHIRRKRTQILILARFLEYNRFHYTVPILLSFPTR